MKAKLLEGKSVSNIIKSVSAGMVDSIRTQGNSVKLAVIQVGSDPASNSYIKSKEKACEFCGIESNVYQFEETAAKWQIVEKIKDLNEDDSVNGILVQLPLPGRLHKEEQAILSHINPLKDVDGFTAENVGNLALGNEALVPCTALGIVHLLNFYNISIAGKECVVVGRSNIVGKPMAQLLLRHNGTVTVCHSQTENLKEVCKRADILICAIGKPKFFNEEYVKEGAVVIDVGINRTKDGKLCGDVDFESVKDIAGAISPTPGGVGLTTVAALMFNCTQAYDMQHAK